MKGFMHVNGVTYDLGPQANESSLSQLAEHLRASTGTQRQAVFINEERVDLTINLANVWASATWVEAERDPGVPRRIR